MQTHFNSMGGKVKKILNFYCKLVFIHIFALVLQRGFSSAGSEHLPYKQRVGGSNPSTPTIKPSNSNELLGFLFAVKSVNLLVFSTISRIFVWHVFIVYQQD